jgi:uncharacterized protein YbjT (DUF2867 family)
VVGSCGGVGQLVTAKLLERGFKVRALVRSEELARRVLGADVAGLSFVQGDTRELASLDRAEIFAGVAAVACCTGTTAFPSQRWEGNNGPRATEWEGTRNLIDAAARHGSGTLRRFVLVTSAGVERFKKAPYSILNFFGEQERGLFTLFLTCTFFLNPKKKNKAYMHICSENYIRSSAYPAPLTRNSLHDEESARAPQPPPFFMPNEETNKLCNA